VLDDVIGNYLADVTEREFDAPLLAMLRQRGFTSIHQLHGAFEFGKDFIAKKVKDGVLTQYAIQSKAGDLGMPEWREVRYQLDEARRNVIAHPDFDASLPRIGVLLTTGRLKGGASADAQQYAEYARQREDPHLEVWDRDVLIEWLSAEPLTASPLSIQGALLELTGALAADTADHRSIELTTRTWADLPHHQAAIYAAVLANQARRAGRLDLAAIVALCLLRAARCWSFDGQAEAERLAISARRLYCSYAADILDAVRDTAGDALQMVRSIPGPPPILAYPVYVARIAESLALLSLAPTEYLAEADKPRAQDAGAVLSKLLRAQVGLPKLVSDKWAISLVLALLAVKKSEPALAARVLREAVRWVADAYDSDGIGLAAPDASIATEVEHALGGLYDHVAVTRRPDSYAATLLIDLAACLGFESEYNFAVNEILAVKADPVALIADESAARWGASMGSTGLARVPLVRYAEPYEPSVPLADHHATPRPPGPAWDALALALLPRDRLPIEAMKAAVD
jgi:hypothetical protein